MTQHEIIALRCLSCGGGITEPSRDKPFGAEFRCGSCGVTSVLIIDRALVPLGILQKEGEKVCLTCGRVAVREAQFCQEGHPLTRRCVYAYCSRDFAVDHQRCDFCGNLQTQPPGVYQGTVKTVFYNGDAEVKIEGFPTVMMLKSWTNRKLKEGEQITVEKVEIQQGICEIHLK